MPTKQSFLIDQFDQAIINGPPGAVNVRNISLMRDGRISLFQHPTSEVAFPAREIKVPARLRFAIAMLSSVWQRMQSPVEFSIAMRDANGQETLLFSKSINPRRNADERNWLDHEIEVPPSKTPVQLIFRTRVAKRKGSAWCWAAWANPTLIEPAAAHQIATTPRTQPLIVLVTSDALRMDHLGCYGGAVDTPNLDLLAAEGVRAAHARTQSSVSMGAYASLLTSRNPLVHGITGEWGNFPAHILSLPTQLSAWGYHTIIAASEAELDDKESGFSSLFAERIPTVGHPAQIGEITIRRVLERLQHLPDIPTLLWIQLFDTHPPLLAPGDFSKRYYSGDPTSSQNQTDPEKVAAIRGVETLADLLASIEHMRSGKQQASVTARLRGTADCLLGRTSTGPDLVSHLRSAPPEVIRKQDLQAFALWLDEQVCALEANQPASMALLSWLEQLLPFLRSIEADIIAWLDGVQDYRFALAQYKASVTYMDAHFGRLRQGLKDLKLDDHTSWVFTSPHGEALGEADTVFHHHLLHEACLRVPLIMRPAPRLLAGHDWNEGNTLDGIIDLIDIYPTLLDAYGIPCPSTLEGHSRWRNILSGREIQNHLSFSVDRNAVALSVTDTHYKHWLCLSSHSTSAQKSYETGEHYVYAIDGCVEQLADDPTAAQTLGEALTRWHANQ